MTHILRRKKSDDVDMAYFAKITANVRKSLKSVSFGADFLFDEKKLKIAMLNEPDFIVKIKL